MGLQDRDYWKERYDEIQGIRKQPTPYKHYPELRKMKFFKETENGASESQQQRDGRSNEFSFIGKLLITFLVLLGAALAYRYLR